MLRLTLFTFASMLALGACEHYVPPADFEVMDSVNVGVPASNFPEGQTLTPAEQEVFDERGKPDFIRARWDRRGGLVFGGELRQRFQRQRVVDIMSTAHHQDMPEPYETSWIYRDPAQPRYQRTGDRDIFRGDEVMFTSETHYDVEPVSDQLAVIIDNGDPEEQRQPETMGDHNVEHWIYYHEGKIFHFVDGHLADVESIPPMPIRVNAEI